MEEDKDKGFGKHSNKGKGKHNELERGALRCRSRKREEWPRAQILSSHQWVIKYWLYQIQYKYNTTQGRYHTNVTKYWGNQILDQGVHMDEAVDIGLSLSSGKPSNTI